MEEKNNELCCVCDSNISNGAILRSFESENFEIFGNISQNSVISLRYISKAISTQKKSVTIDYSFNNNDTKTIELAKCKYNTNGYCATIDLSDNLAVTFSLPCLETYNIKIAKDTYNCFIQKYDRKIFSNDTPALPILDSNKNWFKKVLYKFKEWLNTI